ncbi:MAG TPA: hypothetical protein VJZ26_17105 [Blastocatellia bacterium]|nr:hypothetical protein [Blastocatellia bacterium]
MIKFQAHAQAIRRAKNAALYLFFATLAASFIPAPSARAQAEAPDLVIESARRDFGDVFAGEELDHVFVVRNAGGAPLELAEKSVSTGSSLRESPGLIKAVSFKRAAPS